MAPLAHMVVTELLVNVTAIAQRSTMTLSSCDAFDLRRIGLYTDCLVCL